MWNRLLRSMLALLLAGAAQGEEIVDGIAAQVGSEIVLISEVNVLVAPVAAELRAAGAPPEEIAKMRATILDRLIERRLIEQVVRRAELEATDIEVDSTLATIAHENGLTFEELQESVEAQGLPFDAYRERIRGEIEQAKVLNGMVAARVRVEEDEIRALYQKRLGDQPKGGEEVHLRHLLVAFTSDSPAARSSACAEVRAGLARVRAGESFASVAKELSQTNPRRGGDIGWIHADSMAGWMAGAVSALGPGETSDVIETSFGCNLLQLVERRSYEPITYEEAREVLRQELFDLRMQEEYLEFMDTLREQTYVERKGSFSETSPLGSETAGEGAEGAGLP